VAARVRVAGGFDRKDCCCVAVVSATVNYCRYYWYSLAFGKMSSLFGVVRPFATHATQASQAVACDACVIRALAALLMTKFFKSKCLRF